MAGSADSSGSLTEVAFPTGDAVYFDTVAWNRLLDQPDRERTIEGLRSGNVAVLPSIFNVVEIANTKSLERRVALCGLIRRVSGSFPLLGHPMEVAIPMARAVLDGSDDYLFPEKKSASALLRYLDNPADEEIRAACLEWRTYEEEKFARIFDGLKPAEPNHDVEFLTREVVDGDGVLETLLLFEPAQEAGLTLPEMQQICRAPNDSIWTAVRAMLAYWLQDASRHAGKRRPNAFDLWPAVYLGLPIHAFVTNDAPLLAAARQINGLLTQRRLILSFEEFHGRLAY